MKPLSRNSRVEIGPKIRVPIGALSFRFVSRAQAFSPNEIFIPFFWRIPNFVRKTTARQTSFFLIFR